MSQRALCAALTIVSALFSAATANAAETDQFMTWNIELKDSRDLLNEYLNQAAQEYAEKRNRSNAKVDTLNEMTAGYYLYLFEGLHSSRLRTHIWETPEIDRYPSSDTSAWTYQRSSIYRGLSFPYLMPMARTIRVADVYFGIDKVCHFFGFGRRYFQRYERLRGQGVDDQTAIERVIDNGLGQESSLVGGLVDGIFSRGDLEANFQGFMMLRELSNPENPLFTQKDGAWCVARPVDFGAFVSPGFDESYNISYYSYFRWRKVAPLLVEKYCGMPEFKARLDARFDAYKKYPQSTFIEYMYRQFEKTGNPKLQRITFEDLCERTKNNTYACSK